MGGGYYYKHLAGKITYQNGVITDVDFPKYFSNKGNWTKVTNNNGGGGGGDTSWPPAAKLTEYGLSGMPQPSGSTNISWQESNNAISISFSGNASNESEVKSWLTNNGWTAGASNASMTVYTKSGFNAVFSNNGGGNYALGVTKL